MDFVIGSEIECCVREQPPHVNNIRSLGTTLARAQFQINPYGYHDIDKYRKWSIHGDGSIQCSDYNQFGAELVSPCLPEQEYFNEYFRMISYLGNNITTNSSTGFHHGISCSTETDSTLLTKRALLVMYNWCRNYEKGEITRWGREDNQYCRAMYRSLNQFCPSKQVVTRLGYRRRNANDYPGVETIKYLPQSLGKYSTINFTKLIPNNIHKPYLECRVMGGRNYHTRHDDVATTLANVMKCIIDALDGAKSIELFDKMSDDLALTAGNKTTLKNLIFA